MYIFERSYSVLFILVSTPKSPSRTWKTKWASRKIQKSNSKLSLMGAQLGQREIAQYIRPNPSPEPPVPGVVGPVAATVLFSRERTPGLWWPVILPLHSCVRSQFGSIKKYNLCSFPFEKIHILHFCSTFSELFASNIFVLSSFFWLRISLLTDWVRKSNEGNIRNDLVKVTWRTIEWVGCPWIPLQRRYTEKQGGRWAGRVDLLSLLWLLELCYQFAEFQARQGFLSPC